MFKGALTSPFFRGSSLKTASKNAPQKNKNWPLRGIFRGQFFEAVLEAILEAINGPAKKCPLETPPYKTFVRFTSPAKNEEKLFFPLPNMFYWNYLSRSIHQQVYLLLLINSKEKAIYLKRPSPRQSLFILAQSYFLVSKSFFPFFRMLPSLRTLLVRCPFFAKNFKTKLVFH